MRILREQMRRGHQHTWSADAALRSTALQKCLLQRMERSTPCEALDGFYGCVLSLKHWHKATVHKLAVHADGTGTALSLATAFLGARKAQVFAKHVEQPFHRRRIHGAGFAVHCETDGGAG
jgi:hypothetical protein